MAGLLRLRSSSGISRPMRSNSSSRCSSTRSARSWVAAGRLDRPRSQAGQHVRRGCRERRRATRRYPRGLIGSGAKSGSSPACSASARCISAVRIPSWRASTRKKSSGSGRLDVSLASGKRVVEIARQVVERLRPAVSLIADKPEQHAERVRLLLRSRRRARSPTWRAAAACWRTRRARPETATSRSRGADRAAAADRA